MSRGRGCAGRTAALAAVLAMSFSGAASAQDEPAASFTAAGTKFAVATESPYAARAARDVLAAGGSVADAAIAAVLDLGVTRQEMCGLGGGGFLVHRSRDGKVRTIDFREVSAAAPYSDGVMHRSLQGSTYETGHDVIGVPGTLSGLALAHDLFGVLPWSRLFDRAIADARDGHRVAPITAANLNFRKQDIRLFRGSRALYFKDDENTYAAHDLLVQPDLAATLARLARGSTEAARQEFYRSGQTARLLAAEFENPSPYAAQGDDSPITAADLRNYEAITRDPVVSAYTDDQGNAYQVLGMGPPSSGGIAIAEMLNILEGDDLDRLRLSDRLHLLAEAQKIAFADRATWLGDPAYTRIPVQELIQKEYGQKRRGDIQYRAGSYSSGKFDGYDEPGTPPATSGGAQTTSVSIIGGDGEAIVVQCTQETALGSAVVVPGTGILLNGQLADFDEGAPAGAANAYGPVKRPRSSQSPTLVVKDGQVVLAAGAQGGPKIITAVLQIMLGVLDTDLGVKDAVMRPRVHFNGHKLLVEKGFGGDPNNVFLLELQARGHFVEPYRDYDPAPATVTAVSAGSGQLTATNDARPGQFADGSVPAVPGSAAG